MIALQNFGGIVFLVSFLFAIRCWKEYLKELKQKEEEDE